MSFSKWLGYFLKLVRDDDSAPDASDDVEFLNPFESVRSVTGRPCR
jgi:hypothetical protein